MLADFQNRHCILQKIFNKIHATLLITPYMCRCTTLRNLKFKIFNHFRLQLLQTSPKCQKCKSSSVGYHGYHFWLLQQHPKILRKLRLCAGCGRQVAPQRPLQTRSTFHCGTINLPKRDACVHFIRPFAIPTAQI